MVKKRKQKPAVAAAPEPAVCETTAAGLDAPWITGETFDQRFSQAGYLCTLALLACAMLFLWTGYQHRPQILDFNLIGKIIENPEQVIPVYPGQEAGLLDPATNKAEGFFVHVNPDRPAGFLMPMDWLDIPENLNVLGISFTVGYTGDPVVYWGFSKEETPLDYIRSGSTTAKVEFGEYHGDFHPFTIIPEQYQRTRFAVSWDEADYFYLLAFGNQPSELAVLQMTFIGYQ